MRQIKAIRVERKKGEKEMAELEKTMDQAFSPVENTPPGESNRAKAMTGQDGKYLTFSMAGEEYGIGILKIKDL